MALYPLAKFNQIYSKCRALRSGLKVEQGQGGLHKPWSSQVTNIFDKIQLNPNLFTGVGNKLSDRKVAVVCYSDGSNLNLDVFINHLVLAKDFVFISFEIIVQ